ncbi:SEC-C domain-containing protein [Salimicrobium jeotgali]|uniref:SEC-C domain-containing protein n=1 Tax=Salimicrobium jeotgali TaxID=1230341 RepID=UPI000C83D53E|nr:SEC-C domain-containing protein [Salimicrobium jeotgali]
MSLNKNERLTKIDPYELCPCGSGNKFKFCCHQRARKSKPFDFSGYSTERINHMFKENWGNSNFKTCLAFNNKNCQNAIKSAHALQNNRILNRISEDGHVYTFANDVGKEVYGEELSKISKNKASTFFGFCDYHDTELFKPIELKEYEKSELQNFLFSFRGFCLEYHRKKRKLNFFKDMFNKYPYLLLESQFVYLYRISQLDVRDAETEYEGFKYIYDAEKLKDIYTLHRHLNFEVEFAVSSAFSVSHDVNGNEILSIHNADEDIEVPGVYINIFPVENGTNIILSYNKKYEKVYKEYFKQLENLSESEILKHLNFLIVNYTENIFFSPRLIERLNSKEIDVLLRSFRSSIVINDMFDLMIRGEYFDFNLFKLGFNN